ncbi:MAG: FMN-binding protein [Phycisphaerales bacterium]|nr:FMN-binding protein [Phycisphaerales bacterium]
MNKFIHESWLILLMGATFAVLLAGAQTSLSGRIKENQEKALNEAIGAVVSGTVTTERVKINGYDRDVFKCLDTNGKMTGWAIEGVGMGFADKIRLVIGLGPDAATISGLKVIDNIETPGLGNKIADEGPDTFAEQFPGLRAVAEIAVVKGKPDEAGNEIQAITGATISSDAVAKIVNEALGKVRAELARTGAATGK